MYYHKTHVYAKKDVHFHRQRYALCITIQRNLHSLQIVVTQQMTLHCSLYDLETYYSLKTILFLLQLNASNVLKDATQEFVSIYFNQI
jgi:hypothetical protein